MQILSKSMNAHSLKGLELIIVILCGAMIGVWSIYAGLHLLPQSSTAATTAIQPGGPFQLTITEIMDSAWNSTLAQPKFDVESANGLESSSDILLPAHRLIQLTIISYDTPTAGSTDQEGKVSGTFGGTVYMINGTTAMGTNASQPWGTNVTAEPGSMLAHTFTIPQLGINIPVVGGDTEIAYLYLNQTGAFPWLCETPCGFGPTGMQGAMSTSGWMEGEVTVY